MSEQNNRENCYICGRGNADILESHHIVPRRFGGGDESPNLVDLCPSCHRALERLYDKRFYDELGVTPTSDGSEQLECGFNKCSSTQTSVLKHPHRDVELVSCDHHRVCGRYSCDSVTVVPVPTEEGEVVLACDEHIICTEPDCYSTDVTVVENSSGDWHPACSEHVDELRTPFRLGGSNE